MKPGATTKPFTSTTVRPFKGDALMAAMRPPPIPTFRTASSPDSGSMTRPFARTTSYCWARTWAAKKTRIERYFIARNLIVRHNSLLRRLLIRPGAVGDCIVALPSLERMKADYTEVWVPSQIVPLIQFADRASRLPSAIDSLGLPGIDPPVGLLDHLRGFDSIVSWYGSNQPLFRKNVGDRGLPFQFFPALPPVSGQTHIVDFFLAHAGALPGAVPRIAVKPVEHGSLLVHPFSGSPLKTCPMAKFLA